LRTQSSPTRRERFEVAREIEDLRLRLWMPAVAMWQDHFWTGVGPNHFDYRYRQYRPADDQLQGRPDRVHNDYLNTLVDWGVIGALIIAACWGVFYWQVLTGWKYVQRTQNDLGARRSNRSAFVLGGSIGLVAILVHSFLDFNMHIPSNAILAAVLMALVGSHYRFATERHWHTVRWPLRIPVLALLLIALIYLGDQTWQRTRECYWLGQAADAKPSSDEQVNCWKKAFAAENRNFETAFYIGEALRMQSWRGLSNYRQPAEEAASWFKTAIRLNPFDPWAQVRLGMCLDWLGRFSDATPHYQRAFQLDPNNGTVLAHIGWHYFQLENYAEAKDWLQRSYNLNWNATANPIPHSYLAIIRERFGENPPRK